MVILAPILGVLALLGVAASQAYVPSPYSQTYEPVPYGANTIDPVSYEAKTIDPVPCKATEAQDKVETKMQNAKSLTADEPLVQERKKKHKIKHKEKIKEKKK